MESKKKLLLIDDDPSVCSLLKLKLEKTGKYTVIACQDGEAGIAAARKESPDLIVLDLVMPGVQGVEVAENLADIPKTSAIPIVFLSSLIRPGDVPAQGAWVSGRYLIPKSSNINGIISGIDNFIQNQPPDAR